MTNPETTSPEMTSTGEQGGLPEASGEQSGRGLKLHHLRPAPGAHKAKTRVGRGEASKGKTAGRGTKGTKARNTVRLGFEGGQMPLHRRVPKLKGFSNAGFGTAYQVVNTGRLADLFPEGGDVTPENLVARGAARKGELIKVLGTGDISVALRVTAHAFSATAVRKIEQAGGTVTELS
jgi:large subunit ribosomal protein L15